MNDSERGRGATRLNRIVGAEEEPRVRDLMLLLSEYSTVSSEATLGDALVALSKAQMGLTYDRHHHRAILALDGEGKVVGKLSYWAILRSLEPKLLSDRELRALNRAGLSADFIDSLRETVHFFKGSLKRMCVNAARVKVKDAMVPAGEGIDEHAPLTEAIHRMVLEHSQSVLVTRKDEVIGVLRLSDVFEEVADAIREDCD